MRGLFGLRTLIISLTAVGLMASAATAANTACGNAWAPTRELYPSSVVAFIEANPKYTDKWMKKFSDRIEAYFEGRVLEDWTNLVPHLPAHAESTLDIGSGIGGIDVLMAERYKNADISLTDQANRIQDGKSFNVLNAARELFKTKQIQSSRVHLVDSATPLELNKRDYDVILSLRALAYMFPFEYYHDLIRDHLRIGGVLILDVGTWESEETNTNAVPKERFQNGFEDSDALIAKLKKEFGSVEMIRRGADSIRVKVLRTR